MQRPAQTWALGSRGLDFAAPAVFHEGANRFYAAVQPEEAGPGPASRLLSWEAGASGGTIQQLSRQTELPGPVHALLPCPSGSKRPRPGPDGEEAQADADDGGGDTPGALALLRDGSLALCSAAAVLSHSTEAAGLPPVAVSVDRSAAAVVALHHTPAARRSAGARTCLSTHTVEARLAVASRLLGPLRSRCLAPLPPGAVLAPSAAATPVAAGRPPALRAHSRPRSARP